MVHSKSNTADQDLVPTPQIGGFGKTQSELAWYGSNPESIDRDSTPEAECSEQCVPVVPEE